MEPLARSYERCRALHRRHGRTYYLATRLLPAWKRRHVHALYGFTRYADEIVDTADETAGIVDTADETAGIVDTAHETADRTSGAGGIVDTARVAGREARLAAWSARFLAGLGGEEVDDPLLPAVLHTIRVFDLDLGDFRKFLASMAMDLTVTRYGTYDDLLGYMEGSAAVIGTMMLPILESSDPAAAREPARQLGLAFQLTNFIRDVDEDLGLGRIYLPAEDLARFGVTPGDLHAARAAGTAGRPVRELIAYEVRRARGHYALAAPGVTMLAPASQACIRAAYRLYGGILDEVEKLDYDVFARRAVVSTPRRAAVAFASIVTPAGRPVLA